jgi:hypothetical protein
MDDTCAMLEPHEVVKRAPVWRFFRRSDTGESTCIQPHCDYVSTAHASNLEQHLAHRHTAAYARLRQVKAEP